MADISKEIQDFQDAVYGEEVRGSMISLAQKVNQEVEKNTEDVNASVTEAKDAVNTANEAAQRAEEAISQANTTLEGANQAAEAAKASAASAAQSTESAASAAQSAEESKNNAAQSAQRAEEIAEGLGGFDGKAESVKAVDKLGILIEAMGESTVQELLDEIENRIINKLFEKSNIVNNLLTTEEGFALDARQGSALKGEINTLYSNKENKSDVPSNAFSLGAELTDALDRQNKSGIHVTGPNTKNLPDGGAYGQLVVSKSSGDAWIFLEFVPTYLGAIYYNFYNGYGNEGWLGWVKILAQKI